MTYPGETSPRYVMRLRSVGNGEFVGDVDANSITSMLYQCPLSKAQIRFRQIGMGSTEYAQCRRAVPRG